MNCPFGDPLDVCSLFVLKWCMLPGHEALLKAIEECRREANAARRMHRARSGMVRCLDAMVEEMDAVA